MPKFTFEVEVTGVCEGWELALWIKDSVNMSHSWRPLWVERVEEHKCEGDGCDHE